MNDQINGSAATAPMVPVDELGAVDREDSPAVCHLDLSCGSERAPRSRSTDFRGTARSRSALCLIVSKLIVRGESGAQASALSHIDDMTVFSQAINKRGGEMVVPEKGTPFAETQVGSDESGFLPVTLLHQGEEKPDLNRFHFNISDLVDEQQVPGKILFEHFVLGVIGDRSVEIVDEFSEQDVSAAVTLIDGVNEKTGGQSGFAASGSAHPDDVLRVLHVAHGIVEAHDFLPVELRLPVKGKGFDDQGFGNARLLESEATGVFTPDPVFLIDEVLQKSGVGKVLLRGHFEIIIPVFAESFQTKILQFFL